MSVRSLNKVLLIGNLTRDPELRYTPNGVAVCSFGLATNRSWVTEAGEKKEETEFHRIVSWNKLAELCSQLLTKGRKVFVEGRLQTRSWQGQDGASRTSTEIVIDDMIILDSRKFTEAGQDSAKMGMPSSPPPAAAAQTSVVAPPADDTVKQPLATSDQKDAKEEESNPPTPKENVNIDDIPF